MAEDDGALGQAFGAGGAHVVLAEGFEHAGTGDAGDGGDEAGGEGDGGQDQMFPGADAGRWQEPELDGKDQDQNDCEEELRRDDAEDCAHGGGGVDHRSPAQGGENAEGQAEGNAEDDGGTSEAETVGQALEDHAGGGHAVAEGVAEVELQRFLPEDDVLDDGMLVQPHLAADLLVFLLDFLGIAVGVEVDAEAGGIAGYADQEEDQRHDHQYDKDRLQQAADDESAHGRVEA